MDLNRARIFGITHVEMDVLLDFLRLRLRLRRGGRDMTRRRRRRRRRCFFPRSIRSVRARRRPGARQQRGDGVLRSMHALREQGAIGRRIRRHDAEMLMCVLHELPLPLEMRDLVRRRRHRRIHR